MALSASKRSVMTLYSGISDLYSHRVRLVFAEKGVNVDVINVSPTETPQELLEINPYGTFPTLIDRDLVLYETNTIIEYLDERFPHPPLLPVYPVARAKSRQMIYRIERDWYSLLPCIENSAGNEREAKIARKQLQDSLMSLSPLFAGKPYFLSDEFTLVDCCIAPLLWRLPKLGIELPSKAIKDYAERLFKRPTFKISLSEADLELASS